MPNPYTFVNWGLLGEGKEPVLERREEYVLEYTYINMWDDFRLRDLHLYNYPIYSIDNAQTLITDAIIDKIYYYLYEQDNLDEVIQEGELRFPYTIEIMGKTLEIPTDLEFYVGQYHGIGEIEVLLTETEERVGYQDRVYPRYTGNWFRGPLTTFIHEEINTIDEYIQYQINKPSTMVAGVELMKMERVENWERDIEGVYLNKIRKGDE